MKYASFFLLMLATPAMAQQPDPTLNNVCQQILVSNIIQIAAQAQNLSKQLEETKAELATLKEERK